MVGLNDEMGRELLWRQFPTDQRGSYFRQFWDVGDTIERDASKPPAKVEEDLLDISKLHTWGRETQLGDPTHANRPLPTGAEPGEARLVLVVRGDLLKKYPTAVIYAQQAKWITDDQGRQLRVLDESNPAAVHQDTDLQGGDRSGRPLPRLRSDLQQGEGRCGSSRRQSGLVLRDPGASRRAALRTGRPQR